MTSDLILFFFLAVVAIASALGMLFSKSAIYSALNLILNFGAVAIFYLLLSAPFIFLIQVTVYAGAIMVLFLFVIMLLGAERTPGLAGIDTDSSPWQRPTAVILGLILLVEAAYVILFRSGPALAGGAVVDASFGSPQEIGTLLYNAYLLPFEITSVLLLVAMIGAIVLSVRRDRRQRGAGPDAHNQ